MFYFLGKQASGKEDKGIWEKAGAGACFVCDINIYGSYRAVSLFSNISLVLSVFYYRSYCCFLQEENLWRKKQEDELHRNMTQLNLLEKHKDAIAKKSLLFTQQSMVIARSEPEWGLDSR